MIDSLYLISIDGVSRSLMLVDRDVRHLLDVALGPLENGDVVRQKARLKALISIESATTFHGASLSCWQMRKVGSWSVGVVRWADLLT